MRVITSTLAFLFAKLFLFFFNCAARMDSELTIGLLDAMVAARKQFELQENYQQAVMPKAPKSQVIKAVKQPRKHESKKRHIVEFIPAAIKRDRRGRRLKQRHYSSVWKEYKTIHPGSR